MKAMEAQPPVFLDSYWCTLAPSPITLYDVAVWPTNVNILLEFSFFFGHAALASGC